MLLIPAIDLFAGRVVRLTQGDYDRIEVYHEDPLLVARRWEEEGVPMLHVVDLEGARFGEPKNFSSIERVIKGVTVPVQVGGGVRDLPVFKKYLEAGAAFVVVGSVVVKAPQTFEKMLEVGKEKVVVSLDVRDGELVVSGWLERTPLRAASLARSLSQKGVSRFIFTDVSRDGTLEGVNPRVIQEFLEESGVSVIVAGGVKGEEDILLLRSIRGVEGVILGKVLYAGFLNFKAILRRIQGE
ncbi:MAG: 1-(5-phosphoribosyl)-5-[(5-phosphoribosylamino)methylideneamino]imidazole-4-carboxamide isomerase [Candidatus Caldatribacteriaceae bacterium]